MKISQCTPCNSFLNTLRNGTTFSNNGIINATTGYRSLFNNTSGSNNTANGLAGLFANTTGRGNVALGYTALSEVTRQ
jgi:hypothetical protein